jgi:TnpA family transposase
MMTVPLDHLKRTRWKRHALEAGETINPNYYEMGAWQRLKEGLRTGDMAVQVSRRYREFDSYLLPQDKWQALKDSQQTRLAVTDKAKTYLQERQQRIQDLLTQLPLTLNQETFLTLDEAGLMHLKRAEKSTPEEAKAWSQKLYAHCPLVELADVIIEVAASTGCLAPFVHLTTGQAPTARQTEILIAALMGSGMNLGLSKMAQATDFTPDQLEMVADWFIREETLQPAQIILDNFVLHQPFSRSWGQGTTSSSDGIRLPVPVKAANALYNARYFGFKRGITIVTHAADIWMPFSTTVADDAREALHVIDALCHHETDFDLQEHYTDTGGYTYHVFALTMMLGFRFAPRIRSIAEQYLYTVEPMAVDGAVQHLIRGQVDGALITQNWDEMRRLAASIRHGTVSAALIMRKLAAYPKQNRLAQAFNEMGKLERTIHILSYLQDPTLQQRIQRGLNKGEALHALEDALRMGNTGDMREREVDAQLNRASCLMFLVSAISAWNTVYLNRIVSFLAQQGISVPAEYLPHIAPLGWNHINFLGRYEFDLSQSYSLDRLHPLRSPKITL